MDLPAGSPDRRPVEQRRKLEGRPSPLGYRERPLGDSLCGVEVTALQRKGVPSRFIHFPDENHWVLKPQNSKLWHDEVLAWIGRWTRK